MAADIEATGAEKTCPWSAQTQTRHPYRISPQWNECAGGLMFIEFTALHCFLHRSKAAVVTVSLTWQWPGGFGRVLQRLYVYIHTELASSIWCSSSSVRIRGFGNQRMEMGMIQVTIIPSVPLVNFFISFPETSCSVGFYQDKQQTLLNSKLRNLPWPLWGPCALESTG